MIYIVLMMLVSGYAPFANMLLNEGAYKEAAIEYQKAIYAGEGDSLWTKVVYAYEKSGDYKNAYRFMDKYNLDDITVGRISFYIGDTLRINALKSPFKNYYKGLYFLSEGRFEKAINTFPNDSIGIIVKKKLSEYKKIKYKNPYLASAISVFFPGAGRIYAGNAKDGIFNFLMCTVIGGAAIYYYETDAPLLAYVTGGAFIGFYLGDIYGSFVNVLKYNRWQKIKLIKESYDIPVISDFIYP